MHGCELFLQMVRARSVLPAKNGTMTGGVRARQRPWRENSSLTVRYRLQYYVCSRHAVKTHHAVHTHHHSPPPHILPLLRCCCCSFFSNTFSFPLIQSTINHSFIHSLMVVSSYHTHSLLPFHEYSTRIASAASSSPTLHSRRSQSTSRRRQEQERTPCIV